jgi:hypothetical protein
MDPKKAECIGLYLYGAGFYSREQNTLGIVTGHGSAAPHFCLTCPKLVECEDQHEQRVRRTRPADAEAFDRRMREARRREIPATLAAAWLANKGLDPFAAVAIENFSRGHAERGKTQGTLIQ